MCVIEVRLNSKLIIKLKFSGFNMSAVTLSNIFDTMKLTFKDTAICTYGFFFYKLSKADKRKVNYNNET